MAQRRRSWRRRNGEAWRGIVSRFAESGLTLREYCARLSPASGINPYGRTDLEIHGDKAPYNHTACTGCIIEGPSVRKKIAQGLNQDSCLQVVP